MKQDLRAGYITSSEVWKLCGFGKREMTTEELAARPKSGKGSATKTIEDENSFSEAGLTYILETNMERIMGRRIDNETDAHPTSWGRLMEFFTQQTLLGPEYKLMGTDVVKNQKMDFHRGSPDCQKFDEGKTVCDIKAPFTMKSFFLLVNPIYCGLTGMEAMTAIRSGFTDKDGVIYDKHPDGEKYYQQLVSNAIITDSKFAELIVVCPYESELNLVREAAGQFDGNQNQFRWLEYAYDEHLPYLPDGGFFKSLNVIRFEVPQADKDLLTKRIEAAGKLLINHKHQSESSPKG